MWTVYVLRSLKDTGYYIGCTSDVAKRLTMHNKGRNTSTKYRKPFELIHKETYTSRTEAYFREKEIKSYKGGEAFKKLIHA